MTIVNKNLHFDAKNNDKNKWISFYKIMNLNMRFVFQLKYLIFIGIIFPFVITMSFSMFLPIWFGFTLSIYTSLLISSSMTFASLFFSYTTGSMNRNLSLTKGTKMITLASVWISMLLLNFLVVVVVMLTMIILTAPEIAISLMQFSFMSSDNLPTMDWTQVSWVVIAYYWIMCTTVLFASSLFIQRFIKYRKSYFTVVLTYLMISFVLGGTFSLTWTVESGNSSVSIVDTELATITFGTFNEFLVGEPLWIVGQFIPTYQLNQFVFNSVIAGVIVDTNSTSGFLFNLKTISEGVRNTNIFLMNHDSPMIWKYYFLMPYVYIVIFIILYKLHEKYR